MAFTHWIGRAVGLATLGLLAGSLTLPVGATAPEKTPIGKIPITKVSASLTVIPKGGAAKVGGYYMPQRLTLSPTKPKGVKKEPVYQGSPLYGILHFGNAGQNGVVIVLDEKADGSDGKLYVDTNHDGDLTNDTPVVWTKGGTAANVLFQGEAEIQPRLAGGKSKAAYNVRLYRFAPATAKARGLATNLLLYYRDYASTGEITLDGKKYPVAVMDETTTGHFDADPPLKLITEFSPVPVFSISSITPIPMNIRASDPVAVPDLSGVGAPIKPAAPTRNLSILIDRDGDGRFDPRYERFDLSKPFNIAGKTYALDSLSPDGTRITLKTSRLQVAEVPIPPSLQVGKLALAFSRPELDGKTVTFPNDYKGKVVMLDFWATWCGPCRAELPGLVKAYEKYHGRGFEVLGISLDQENMKAKVETFLKENNMTWSQVYDGKYWKADVAQMYGINAIPHAYLVDGDTGKIIDDGSGLRGAALDGTISKAIAGLHNTASR